VRNMKLLAMAIAIVIVAIGIVGIVAPSAMVQFARSLQTPVVLYVLVAVRVAFGALLWWIAPASRMPRTVRVIGVVIIVAGVLTLLFGLNHAEAFLTWWSSQDLLVLRAWASVAIIFGLFIVYVFTSPRRLAA
jgi:hypothetical protein